MSGIKIPTKVDGSTSFGHDRDKPLTVNPAFRQAQWPRSRRVEKVVEVRIVPATACYFIEIVYERPEEQTVTSNYVAGIDLGIECLIALSTNKLGVRHAAYKREAIKERQSTLQQAQSQVSKLLNWQASNK